MCVCVHDDNINLQVKRENSHAGRNSEGTIMCVRTVTLMLGEGGFKKFGKLTRKSLFWCPDSHDLHARIVSGVSSKDPLNVSPHTKHRATEDMIVPVT